MKILFGYWDTRKLAKGITKSFADLTFYWSKTTGDTLAKEVIDNSTASSIIASDNINTIIKQASIESADSKLACFIIDILFIFVYCVHLYV